MFDKICLAFSGFFFALLLFALIGLLDNQGRLDPILDFLQFPK